MIKALRILGPALLSFGPLFIAMPSSGSPAVGYLGAMMLALGLVLLLRTVHAQQREIDELRQALGPQ